SRPGARSTLRERWYGHCSRASAPADRAGAGGDAMQQSPVPISVERVRAEVHLVAAFQGLDVSTIDVVLDELAPHLACYAELALTERGFELLTGGRGAAAAAALTAIAGRHGAPDEVVDGFRACVAAAPDRMLGLKLCFGPGAAGPTLYHRTMAP